MTFPTSTTERNTSIRLTSILSTWTYLASTHYSSISIVLRMGQQSERLSETRFPPYPPDSSRYYKPPVYRRNDSGISPCKHQRDSICMLCRIQFYLLKRNNQNTSDVWRKTTNSVYLRRPDSHHREKRDAQPCIATTASRTYKPKSNSFPVRTSPC